MRRQGEGRISHLSERELVVSVMQREGAANRMAAKPPQLQSAATPKGGPSARSSFPLPWSEKVELSRAARVDETAEMETQLGVSGKRVDR